MSRHAYKYKHVCAATTVEPSHSEEMDNLASEIKSLGDTIRNMKKQMKDSNDSDIDVDKSILEANIASLLEMKGRYASMNEVVNESLVEAIENDEEMKKTSKELKRVDISKLSIRPSLDDVERISKGQAAKRRGTGSRAVPHRLNEMERKEWDLAKKRRYLSLRGSGWRKERGDSPLANIYRQLCDATNIPCISVQKGIGNDVEDCVIIDVSPLRTKDIGWVKNAVSEILESNPYESFQKMSDFSDVEQLGFEEEEFSLEEYFIKQPIWRIPVHGITVHFGDRVDSRDFAKTLAKAIADGNGK